MARILKDHSERRQEFLLTAQQLFHNQGYDNTSVNDILQAMNVAKGTFYHYFTSKEDLLDSLVDMISRNIIDDLKILISNPDMNAVEKMNAVMSISRRWKEANRQIVMAMIKAMYKPENNLLLQKMMEKHIAFTVPFLTKVIQQGVEEGVFHIPDPEDAGELLLRIGYAVNDMLKQYYLKVEEHPEYLDIIKKKLRLWDYTLERFLGTPEGTIKVADDGFVDRLFGKEA
jgi:AcrR family transcriptional regulator